MAKHYLDADEAADVLGVSSDELQQLRERGELRGFRDRSEWKFRADEVDGLAASRSSLRQRSKTPVEPAMSPSDDQRSSDTADDVSQQRRQRLLDRFLEGEIDKETYDQFITEIERLEASGSLSSSGSQS